MVKKTILIVDDEPAIIASIGKVLSTHYLVRVANSGRRALEIAITNPKPDLILLDVMMADMDGYSVLSRLKDNPDTREMPVIFITSLAAETDEEKGLELGAVDYITKPVNQAILLARVKAQLIVKQLSDILHSQNDYLETEINRRMEENQVIQNVSIRALAHLAEIRDPETGDHILRTQSYVQVLAKSLQDHPRFKETITEHYIRLLTKSAPLHDIGKVGIPDHILLKPGKLTSDEFEVMKTHAELGSRAIELAIKDVERPVKFLSLAKEISHWHHERWDGNGYPDGLTEDAIPTSARLMALADVFDALISKRVYKSAMSFDEARKIIVNERNRQFDPDITDAFLANFDEFIQIAEKYQASN